MRPSSAPRGSVTGSERRSYFLEELRDLFLVRVDGDGNHLAVHDRVHCLARARKNQP